MPNHYDIDIWCECCGGYISTVYPDEHIPEHVDRLCDSCKAKGLKPKPIKKDVVSKEKKKERLYKDVKSIDLIMNALREKRDRLVEQIVSLD